MSYPLNYPTPQNANVQIFRAAGASTSSANPSVTQSWVKPQGASFVWFTLIGAGGYYDGVNGGGSGAVTNFMCPAFLIPDELQIVIGESNQATVRSTFVIYQQKNGTGYTLLTANSANSSTGGTATTANYFTAIGFYQSIAGQSGNNSNIGASSTTFLSAGSVNSGTQTSNYGYSSGPSGTDRSGFFQMQPIIVGAGAMGQGIPGVGCGAGSTGAVVPGGPGMAVIITW